MCAPACTPACWPACPVLVPHSLFELDYDMISLLSGIVVPALPEPWNPETNQGQAKSYIPHTRVGRYSSCLPLYDLACPWFVYGFLLACCDFGLCSDSTKAFVQWYSLCRWYIFGASFQNVLSRLGFCLECQCRAFFLLWILPQLGAALLEGVYP